jgi:hypothetical protein
MASEALLDAGSHLRANLMLHLALLFAADDDATPRAAFGPDGPSI